MLDREAIGKRFFSCFPGISPTELARILDVTHPTVFQWLSNDRQVPWAKLGFLVDKKDMSWDWLLDGKEPKLRPPDIVKININSRIFDRAGINQRFLSLFPNVSQTKLANQLGITQTAVSAWKLNRRQVPWEKLKYAVDVKHVTWNWLIEGWE